MVKHCGFAYLSLPADKHNRILLRCRENLTLKKSFDVHIKTPRNLKCNFILLDFLIRNKAFRTGYCKIAEAEWGADFRNVYCQNGPELQISDYCLRVFLEVDEL